MRLILRSCRRARLRGFPQGCLQGMARPIIRLFIAMTLAFSAPQLCAQDDAKPRLDERYKNWYQIELIVFERSGYGRSDEIWPKSVSMIYPRALDHLFSEQEWSEFSRRFPAETEKAAKALESKNQLKAETAIPFQQNTSPFATTFLPEQQAEPTRPLIIKLPKMETPRILLDRSEHALQNKAEAIDKRREFKILAHKAWRQPLLPSSESIAIALAGGNVFDRHNELEGWIKLSLDRFLHFESNLWKVDYEINYGQNYDENSEYWPSIPTFPDAVTQTLEKRKSSARASKNVARNAQARNQDFGFGRYVNGDLRFEPNTARTSITSYDKVKNSRYIVKEIVTLKQKRRMRSEELHYIDHPRLGILVYARPYVVELPEPEPAPIGPLAPFTEENNNLNAQ